MGQSLPVFMERVPEYEVRGGHMHIMWQDLELVLPVNVMLKGMAGARQAIEEWGQTSATILRFPSDSG